MNGRVALLCRIVAHVPGGEVASYDCAHARFESIGNYSDGDVFYAFWVQLVAPAVLSRVYTPPELPEGRNDVCRDCGGLLEDLLGYFAAFSSRHAGQDTDSRHNCQYVTTVTKSGP